MSLASTFNAGVLQTHTRSIAASQIHLTVRACNFAFSFSAVRILYAHIPQQQHIRLGHINIRHDEHLKIWQDTLSRGNGSGLPTCICIALVRMHGGSPTAT